MKKLLRPQDVFLLATAGVADVFSEFQSVFGIARQSYRSLYGWVPPRFKETHYFQVVYHSLRTGYLEKVVKNGEVYLRLTSKGKNLVERDFPFFKWQKQKWDGKWRVVIFDIKEKRRKVRDALRSKMKELGFGMLQESVWISPYDVAFDFREFLESQGMGEEVFVMEVSHLLAGDPRELAAKIWNLGKLNESYKELLDMFNKLDSPLIITHDREESSIAKSGGGEIKRKIKKREIRELKSRYLEILINDPILPKELLPEDWYGEKVKNLIKKLK